MASEPVRITGYLDAEDTNSTLAAVEALGALVDRSADEIVVRGAGLREARETSSRSTSATRARYAPAPRLAGGAGGARFSSTATRRSAGARSTASPRRCAPWAREVDATDERFPPFTVRGARLRSIAYDMPVASAQVKSCVLIAGLVAEGPTTVTEPQPSRDHTERMLTRRAPRCTATARRVTVVPVDELVAGHLHVPGDPSSAAFWSPPPRSSPAAESA